MKRICVVLIVTAFFLKSNAQSIVNDSTTTGSGNTSITFYNLRTGGKTVSSNTDWHIAVSVRPTAFPNSTLQGTTIRINEGFGVKAYQIPGFTEDSFNVVIDTTGFHILQKLNDSDSLLDLGALNTGLNISAFNYGWGIYGGSPNHDVVGKKVYLFELPNGDVKKFLVEQLDRDTAWDLKYANIDNSNLQTLHISKADYTAKNLVYISLTDNVVRDKEPLSSEWDLQFLKYAATDVQQGKAIPVVGVLANKGTTIARRAGVDEHSNDFSGLIFSPNMNAMGWNWKYLINTQLMASGKDLPQQIGGYGVEDSLAYLVQTISGGLYKVVFTAFTGTSSGIIKFYTETLTATRVPEMGSENTISVFPNPANSVLNIVAHSSSATVKVFDVSGRMISENSFSGEIFQLSTSELTNGVYLLAVTFSGGNTSVKRFVVNR